MIRKFFKTLAILFLFPILVEAKNLNEDLPVYFENNFIGEAPSVLDKTGQKLLAIDLTQLPLEKFVSPELKAKILRLTQPVPLRALSQLKLSVTYDPKLLKIFFKIPTELQQSTELSLQNRRAKEGFKKDDIKPETASALINLYPQYRYGDFDQLQGQADAAFRFYSFILTQEVSMLNEAPYRRDTQLVYDLQQYNLRSSVGDVQSVTTEVLVPINGLGASLHTDFGMTLFGRPLPNPSTELLLERRARVNAYSRGQLLQSLVIGPGRFRVQDFQFLNGITEVVFDVQEFGGRSYTLVIPYAVDERQLSKGAHELSYSSAKQSHDEGKSRSYSKQAPVTTFLHRYGFDEKNTIGASGQGDDNHQVVGFELLSVHTFGSFYPKFHLSNDNTNQGARANLEYLLRFYGDKQFNFDYSYQSSKFSRYGQTPELNSHQFGIGLVTRPNQWWSLGLKASQQLRYQGDPLQRYEINLNGRPLRGMSLTFGVRTAQLNQREWDNTASLFLNYFFEDNKHSLEGNYNHRRSTNGSRDNDTRMAARGFYHSEHAQISPQFSASHADSSGASPQTSWQGHLDVRHARGDLSLDHNHQNNRHSGTIGVGLGLAFSPSAFALGRPSPGAYGMVKNNSEHGEKLFVNAPGLYSSYPVSSLPLLVSGLRPYDYSTFFLEAEGDTDSFTHLTKRLQTEFFSGHIVTLPKNAQRSIQFKLLQLADKKVQAFVLVLGKMKNKQTGEIIEFFSNRTGDVFIENISAGDWLLAIGKKRATLTVPDKHGKIDLGAIHAK